MSVTAGVSSTLQETVRPDVHRLAANLIFDEHGLDPYWGLVSAFEPDVDETTEPFDCLDDEFSIDHTNLWDGEIDDPQGNIEGGLYEYKLGVWSTDEASDRGFDVTLRPGFPDARHQATGERIQSIPSECPESLRVQVEATNLEPDEVLELLRATFETIDLNPSYVCEPHEWSRVYAVECYVRVRRDVATERLAGTGGVLEHMAQFSNGRGRGKHDWDHEEIVGHYEAVALDPATWSRLIGDHRHAKRLKCYQPEYVRSDEADADDPLYHHKLEVQYWSDYHDESIRWDGYDQAVSELQQTIVCALNWGDVTLDPDAGPYIADAYWEPESVDEPVEVVANPMPDLEEQEQLDARADLIDPEATGSEFEVLEAVTDGGTPVRYDEVADRADVGSSTVYRAVEQFSQILEIEDGELRFRDEVIRQEIADVVERFRAAKERTVDALRRVAEKATPLSPFNDDDEPSALEQWLNRHGITVREAYDRLEMELTEPISRYQLRKLLREGLEAAERSPLLTKQFENATIDWVDLDGNPHKNWQVVVDGEVLAAGG